MCLARAQVHDVRRGAAPAAAADGLRERVAFWVVNEYLITLLPFVTSSSVPSPGRLNRGLGAETKADSTILAW